MTSIARNGRTDVWLRIPDEPRRAETRPLTVSFLTDCLLSTVLVLTVAGVALLISLHFLDTLFLDARFNTLNADLEENPVAWMGTVAEFGAAVGAFLLALSLPRQRMRYGVLAAILVYFSLDDAIRIHETMVLHVEKLLGIQSDYGRDMWPLIYFPVAGLAFWIMWHAAGKVPDRAGRFVRTGLLMLGASIVCEMLGTTWAPAEGQAPSAAYALEVAVEKALQLGAWPLIAAGLVAMALTCVGSIARLEDPAAS